MNQQRWCFSLAAVSSYVLAAIRFWCRVIFGRHSTSRSPPLVLDTASADPAEVQHRMAQRSYRKRQECRSTLLCHAARILQARLAGRACRSKAEQPAQAVVVVLRDPGPNPATGLATRHTNHAGALRLWETPTPRTHGSRRRSPPLYRLQCRC